MSYIKHSQRGYEALRCTVYPFFANLVVHVILIVRLVKLYLRLTHFRWQILCLSDSSLC